MNHPIYPYGEPRQLSENLWQIAGSLKFPVPRNMTIVRTTRGELVLYSVIAMHEDGMRALEALGRPSLMVIPHRRHQMDAPFYKARYPNLRVLAPDSGRVREVTVDAGLGELAALGIDAYVLPGNTYQDVVLDIALPEGRALCVCESLGNVSPSGWMKAALRLLGPPGGGFGVARAVRLREISDRDALRAWLLTQAARSDVRLLLFGHGEALVSDIQNALRRAAAQV
jgi:hypothetical protein